MHKRVLKSNEKNGIINIAKDAIRNTHTNVKYNPNANFNVEVPQYSHEVNKGLSDAIKLVTSSGSKDGLEHLVLVDSKTGESVYSETGLPSSVGGKDFWDFISNNKDKSLIFVHNHNSDGYFSATDMNTLLKTDNIEAFVASRLDGVTYYTQKTKTISGNTNFDKLFSDKIDIINRQYKDGTITAGERTKLREEIIVDNLLELFTKGLIEYDGR